MLPLVFVLAVTFIKDAYEDRRRGKQDKDTNARLASVFDQCAWLHACLQGRADGVGRCRGEKRWANVEWSNVEVGDIVQVREGAWTGYQHALTCNAS